MVFKDTHLVLQRHYMKHVLGSVMSLPLSSS